MKKKIFLLIALVLLGLAMLCILLLSEQDVREEPGEADMQSAETTYSSADTQSSKEQTSERLQLPIYEDGDFTFAASQFHEQFANTMPEKYNLSGVVTNPLRNDKKQIDILDAEGERTDMAILLDVKEEDITFGRMALAVKTDCDEEDFAAVLNWYLSVFLGHIESSERNIIYEDYLDMFQSGDENYRLYAEETHTVMMCRETEEADNYYYIMISVQ